LTRKRSLVRIQSCLPHKPFIFIDIEAPTPDPPYPVSRAFSVSRQQLWDRVLVHSHTKSWFGHLYIWLGTIRLANPTRMYVAFFRCGRTHSWNMRWKRSSCILNQFDPRPITDSIALPVATRSEQQKRQGWETCRAPHIFGHHRSSRLEFE
jgi:hypothetical protein